MAQGEDGRERALANDRFPGLDAEVGAVTQQELSRWLWRPKRLLLSQAAWTAMCSRKRDTRKTHSSTKVATLQRRERKTRGRRSPTVRRAEPACPPAFRVAAKTERADRESEKDRGEGASSVVSVVNSKSDSWWFPRSRCSFHLPASPSEVHGPSLCRRFL